MKKNYLFILVSLLIMSCASNDELVENGPSIPVTLHMAETPVCKYNTQSRMHNADYTDSRLLTRALAEEDNTEKYILSYAKDSCLNIVHQNVYMQCAASVKVDFKIDSENRIITIAESDVSEDAADCICPYDVKVDIGPLLPSQYKLVLQGYGHKEIPVVINFNKDMKPVEIPVE